MKADELRAADYQANADAYDAKLATLQQEQQEVQLLKVMQLSMHML